mgnify:FL=1
MKKFKIAVTETLVQVVAVEAKNTKEAAEKVNEMYDNSEIVLDYSNLTKTEFIGVITLDSDKNEEN